MNGKPDTANETDNFTIGMSKFSQEIQIHVPFKVWASFSLHFTLSLASFSSSGNQYNSKHFIILLFFFLNLNVNYDIW